MSVPRIGASGCGFWPTSTSDDANNVTRDSGEFQSLTRTVQARGGATPQTWRTPAAQEPGIKTDRLMTKTGEPFGSDCRHYDRETGRNAQIGLTQQVQGRTQEMIGSLNPTWVEWFMGWPRGWTDCEHSVTDKCLRRWLRRSRTWLDRLGF